MPVKKIFGYSVCGCSCKEKCLWLVSVKLYAQLSMPVKGNNVSSCKESKIFDLLTCHDACKEDLRLCLFVVGPVKKKSLVSSC